MLERGPGPACYASHANMVRAPGPITSGPYDVGACSPVSVSCGRGCLQGMMCPSLSQPLGGPTAALYAAIAAAKGLAGVEIDRRGTEGLVVSKDLVSDSSPRQW